MTHTLEGKNMIGINGLGRIGKLLLWNQLASRRFDGAVINLGRQAGRGLDDIIHFMETDSTYGSLQRFLYGTTGQKRQFSILDQESALMEYDGFLIRLLLNERNPSRIPWRENHVKIVADCTGVFNDPTDASDQAKGSLRGHLESGARKVILSAPFKIRDKAKKMPDDSYMMVYGINHLEYDAHRHHVLSAASCTTTGLSHMIFPLLQTAETARMLTASMSTVHAATNSQSVLDAVPSSGATDLRKNRSVLNNIILSSTGAARALEKILPEISEIGFMADSVRIPTSTVSLIILNITFAGELDEKGDPRINKEFLNAIYQQAARGPQKDLLVFSRKQNVSADLPAYAASVLIEGHETHTRTGFIHLPESLMQQVGMNQAGGLNIPVTHAKIFGWYDNEYGSYVNSLGKLIDHIEKSLD